VDILLPEGEKPGRGGRNTHLALLAAERLAQTNNTDAAVDREAVKKGLIEAGISESQIETGLVGCLGYATDVGPISLTPLAVVGVRSHSDVERAVRFASNHGVPINARGAGSGLPAQSVGSGIVMDMRSLDKIQVLGNHPEGGKVVLVQPGVICTRLNNYLTEYGVFLASYPASTDMATVGGMIANNASGANSCKLGTTQHQVMDLHIVLADGTGLWTSEIDSGKQPWKRITELIKLKEEAIQKHYPRVPKNSSGYNVLDIANQIAKGIPVDWTRLFAHSEGTLGIITEAKIRAVPLATQKVTCIVYFTDLQEACGSIPKIHDLGPSCFDVVLTTNLELIRKTYPSLGIREDARAMYIIEFDDLEVKQDPFDPAKRIGQIRIMDREAAADLIRRQAEALQGLIEMDYPKTAIGFEIARDQAQQDALWHGRRNALQVLYAYDPGKRPLTMIECVVLPRDQRKLVDFIRYMEEVFHEEQVVAGTHGHAGDCNFHVYLLLNLSQKDDRKRLINVMTKITRKVAELGGSMSGEHADGRTRGLILPHVFGKELFDLFVEIKDLMDPRTILHPGVKIIKSARDRDLYQAIEELVGIEEQDSQLNLARFRDYSHLFTGVCAFCSQCADICPVFSKLSEQFVARSEAAPTFKRTLATILDAGGDLRIIEEDPLFKKVFDLCLLCGQCTFKCATNASMRDMVMKMRESGRSRIAAPAILYIRSHPVLYGALISLLGRTQGTWQNKLSRRILSSLPQGLLPTSFPSNRQVPRLSKRPVESRYPELVQVPPSEADIAYFYGCSSDLLAEPIADSFVFIARRNGWKISLPAQRCCGEPFASQGNTKEYQRLAKYNIDRLLGYKYVVVHCPSCLLAFREYAKDFARAKDAIYEKKAQDLSSRVIDPAGFITKVIGVDNLRRPVREIRQRIAVHLSCHEKLGLKMSSSPNSTQDLLSFIPGLEVVGMKGADECCGLAGPWGLSRNYELAIKLRQNKIENIIESKPEIVTSWCTGCMLQFRDGLTQSQSNIQVRHPLELLSQAYGKDDS
jgi:FAD/FMN-containing dehydrogenase/Fe-S oxidoreductase